MIFRSPYEQFKERNGQEFVILEKFDKPNDFIDEEVLPMYLIEFEDGEQIHVWPEEIGKGKCPCGGYFSDWHSHASDCIEINEKGKQY